MDILSWVPWIAVSVLSAVTVFIILNHIRTKRLPPTDEPVVGEYRIELDVGTHNVPYEGTLYYFNKFLDGISLKKWEKTLDQDTIEKIKKVLDASGKLHYYAMRQGTKKIAFISIGRPLETCFKTQGNHKLVLASGRIGKERGQFHEYITLEPVDQNTFTLNPDASKKFPDLTDALAILREKTPLVEELEIYKENLQIETAHRKEALKLVTHYQGERASAERDKARKNLFPGKSELTKEDESSGLPLVAQLGRYKKHIGIFVISALIGYLVSPQLPYDASLVTFGFGAIPTLIYHLFRG